MGRIAPHVSFQARGSVGFATLNRPEAVNALSLEMVGAFTRRLSEWAHDPRVEAVVLRGAGPKGFCAGGDVRSLYDAGKSGDLATVERFFREEYRLDLLVARYPKPVAALLDGIVMGGGVGLTIHCPIRIVTERTRFAMPETGLGFFPDVGASYFLPRLPGNLGLYLALTGARLGPAALLACGAATHYLPSGRLLEWERCLQSEGLDGSWRTLPTLRPPEEEDPLPPELSACFSAPSLSSILEALARGGERAASVLASLREKSPTSLRVTFREMTDRSSARLEDALRMEYRLARRFLRDHDFFEGVRAVLVDRDGAPRWLPADLSEVREEEVEEYFDASSLGGADLAL